MNNDNDIDVGIKSNVKATVVLNLPEWHRKIEFPRKGTVRKLKKSMLEDAMYDPGIEFMFENGILMILDSEVRKEVGAGANLIDLTDSAMKNMSSAMTLDKLKETLTKLTPVQQREYVAYVVEHNDEIIGARINLVQEVTGVNVAAAIRLKKQNEEALSPKEG